MIAQNIPRLGAGIDHCAGEPLTDRMQLILERRHHAKVATAAAQGPEEIGMLGGTGGDDLSGGGHHVRRDQIVTAEAVLPHEPANSPTQRQTRDARVVHGPTRRAEAVDLRFAVKFPPQEATLGIGPAPGRVDTHAFHRGKVEH
jgi:hypothetical protein